VQCSRGGKRREGEKKQRRRKMKASDGIIMR